MGKTWRGARSAVGKSHQRHPAVEKIQNVHNFLEWFSNNGDIEMHAFIVDEEWFHHLVQVFVPSVVPHFLIVDKFFFKDLVFHA